MRPICFGLVCCLLSCTFSDRQPVLEGRWKLVRIAGERAEAEEDAFFSEQLQKGTYSQVLEIRGDSLVNLYRRGKEPPIVRRSRYRLSADRLQILTEGAGKDTIRILSLTADSLLLRLPGSTQAYFRD